MSVRKKKSVTLSLRVTPKQAAQIRAAATAGHLDVGPYLYRRVTDKPILSTPNLAALAELISTLGRLETAGRADPELMNELARHIGRLSGSSGARGALA